VPDDTTTRHISIRVPTTIHARLEAHARERDETVSQSARRLLADGLRPGGRNTIDAAIAALEAARDHLVAPPTATTPEVSDQPGRVVNVLNAKANLSRLLADVGRGDEITISHAGHPRAKLVPIDPPN
jgi:prevent-host-death family protein